MKEFEDIKTAKEVFVSDMGNHHTVNYSDVKNEVVKIDENYNLVLKVIKIDLGYIDTPDPTTTFKFKNDEKNIYRFLRIIYNNVDDDLYTILIYKAKY